MKNNMNEMNDEMEITLNESYTFPVISKESFMRLVILQLPQSKLWNQSLRRSKLILTKESCLSLLIRRM